MQIIEKKSSSRCYQNDTRSIFTSTGSVCIGVKAINLLFITAFLIQMQFYTADRKTPKLINSVFTQPDKLQLRFCPMGHFAVSTFTSHVRLPINYSNIISLQTKLNERVNTFLDTYKGFHFNFGDSPKVSTALSSYTRKIRT